MKITDNGISDVQGQAGFIEKLIQGWRTALGDDLDTSSYTPQRQIIDIEAEVLANLEDILIYINNGLNVDSARGSQLDSILNKYGFTRKQATKTTVICKITGISNTFIPTGSRVKDIDNNIFLNKAPITIPVSGTIETLFESENAGFLKIETNALNIIIDKITGWTSVNNEVAGISGSDIQTDFDYRRNYQKKVWKSSVGYVNSVWSNLDNLAGVNRAVVFENTQSDTKHIAPQGQFLNTAGTNTVPITGHSIYAFLYTNIARNNINDVIKDYKNLGCGTNGSESTLYPDGTTISHDLMDTVEIEINLVLSKKLGFSVSTIDEIKKNIVEYFEKSVNNIVYKDDLTTIIKQSSGFNIDSFALKIKGGADADKIEQPISKILTINNNDIGIV